VATEVALDDAGRDALRVGDRVAYYCRKDIKHLWVDITKINRKTVDGDCVKFRQPTRISKVLLVKKMVWHD
jgi:hypothetical protein